MKTADFIAVATRELTEHVGLMAQFVVEDSLKAAQLSGKEELSPRDWQTLMLYFKMNIPNFLDASAICQAVEKQLYSRR